MIKHYIKDCFYLSVTAVLRLKMIIIINNCINILKYLIKYIYFTLKLYLKYIMIKDGPIITFKFYSSAT